MKFDRLYELKELGGNEGYFSDLEGSVRQPLSYKFLAEPLNRLDEEKRNYYNFLAELAESLSRLDEEEWNYLKDQCTPLLSTVSEDRRWSQLFDRLNEAKGYGYLLDRGCSSPKFIKSGKNGRRTPDLEASGGTSEYLCEVKTINISYKEIKRRENGEIKDVAYQLSDERKSKVGDVADKAASQLRNYPGSENKIKIVLFVIHLDDWQPESKMAIFPEIRTFLDELGEDGIEFVLYGSDY